MKKILFLAVCVLSAGIATQQNVSAQTTSIVPAEIKMSDIVEGMRELNVYIEKFTLTAPQDKSYTVKYVLDKYLNGEKTTLKTQKFHQKLKPGDSHPEVTIICNGNNNPQRHTILVGFKNEWSGTGIQAVMRPAENSADQTSRYGCRKFRSMPLQPNTPTPILFYGSNWEVAPGQYLFCGDPATQLMKKSPHYFVVSILIEESASE